MKSVGGYFQFSPSGLQDVRNLDFTLIELSEPVLHMWPDLQAVCVMNTCALSHDEYEGVSKRFRTESIAKYMLTTIKHSLRSNTKD